MAKPKITVAGPPTTPGANGSIPIRREVRDLQKNYKDQWNLYLLGLAELQQEPPTEPLSYYSIASIHGEPFVPWNEAEGNENAAFGGYGPSSSVLFLTWHRAYLALYEQALYTAIERIANEYPESMRERYISAAQNFRTPYWDWATATNPQEDAFPSVFSSKEATIVDVDGSEKQIPNPLHSFRFDDKKIPPELALDSYWNQFPCTIRSPDRKQNNSQHDLINRTITNENAAVRHNVSLILLSYKRYEAFSSNQWLRDDLPGKYGSIEAMHNGIQDRIGQGGHLSSREVASFDPVFWLHHANVDRLWAIWQALNPNQYVTDKLASAREENYFISAGQRISSATELKPFYHSSGTRFLTSAGVHKTTSLGYAYPETQRWVYPSDEVYQAAIRFQITRQYGGNVINNFFETIAPKAPQSTTSTASSNSGKEEKPGLNMSFMKKAMANPMQTAQSFFRRPSAADVSTNGENQKEAQTESNQFLQPDYNTPRSSSVSSQQDSDSVLHAAAMAAAGLRPRHSVSGPVVKLAPVAINVPGKYCHLVKERAHLEWVANLRVTKYGLNQTFRVWLFLGDFNQDPATWPTEYNVVGRFTVLGRGGDGPCEKRQVENGDEDGLAVTGTVPLTSALLQDIVADKLRSLDAGDVVDHLKKNLHWRVTVFDGSEWPVEDVPGLKVGVVSTKVRIADDGVPGYGGIYDRHLSVTEGRPGGLGTGDKV